MHDFGKYVIWASFTTVCHHYQVQSDVTELPTIAVSNIFFGRVYLYYFSSCALSITTMQQKDQNLTHAHANTHKQ